MRKSVLIVTILSALIFIALIILLINGRDDSVNDTGKYSNLTSNNFEDDFESYSTLDNAFKTDLSAWHGFQKTIDGNIVELTSEKAHSGSKSLKTFAVKSIGSETSKADIQRELFNFTKGDDVWVSAWFYLVDSPSARDLFLFDIEAPGTKPLGQEISPGRRIYLGDKNQITSDLGKWWESNIFRQELGKEVPFPMEKWVNVKIHLFLSEDDGIMEVWQDGVKVLNSSGMTLPEADSIYERIQTGITANGNTEYSQTVYVDDVIISDREIKSQ